MKKILLFAVAILGMVSATSAQTFENGSNVISAGVGVGSDYGVPVYASYERGIHDFSAVSHIGVGGMLAYGAHKETVGEHKWKYSDFILAAIANYHYTGVDQFDFYGGVKLGYDLNSGSYTYGGMKYEGDDSSMFFSVQAGARYYFNDTWAINAELGYGLAVLNIGASYKF